MTVQKEVKVLISAVDQYSGGILGFNTMMGKSAMVVAAVEAALIAASIAAAAFSIKIGEDLLKSASDFHDGIYDVTAVAQSFGTTTEQISGIMDGLTQKFPVTGAAAAESMKLIAQLGYGGAEQLEIMSNAANVLQIATGADLQTGIQATMTIMNGFGLEIEETDRVINLLAATAFTSAASVEDMADALKYATPITSQSGWAIEQTAATLGLLKNMGLEASQAGTTLRMGLAQLYKETDRGREALAKYGLTYAEVNPEVNNMSEIIGKFAGQTLSASDAVAIFGVRASAMGSIVNKGQEAFDEYTESITGTSAAYDAMEQKLNKWSVTQEQLAGSLDLLKKTIGVDLVAAMVDVIGTDENSGIRGIVNWMTEMEKEQGVIGDEVMQGFEGMKGAVENFLQSSFGDKQAFYEWLSSVASLLSTNLEVISIWGAELASVFLNSTNNVQMMQAAMYVLNTVIGQIALSVAFVHDAFAVLWNFMVMVNNGLEIAFIRLGETLLNLGVTAMELMDKVGFGDWSEEIAAAKNQIEEMEEKAEKLASVPLADMWTDDATDALYRANAAIDQMGVRTGRVKTEVSLTAEQIALIGDNYTVVGNKITNAEGKVVSFEEAAKKVSEEVTKWYEGAEYAGIFFDKTKEKTDAVADAAEQVNKKLEQYQVEVGRAADGTAIMETRWLEVADGAEKAKEKVVDLNKNINDMTDREFSLYSEKFKADLDLVAQKSKETHDEVMSNIEWTAKLDIAEVEANAKILEAWFSSAASQADSLSESLTAALSGVSKVLNTDFSNVSFIQDLAERQMKLAEELGAAQIDLSEVQTEYLQQKLDLLNAGDSDMALNISMEGDTEPWLAGLIESLFKELVVKASGELFQVFGGAF